MDIIAEIRRRHFVSKESISSIARLFKLSRTTVRKHLKTEVEPAYQRQIQPSPKFGKYKELLESWLKAEAQLPRNQRRTAKRLYDGLIADGIGFFLSFYPVFDSPTGRTARRDKEIQAPAVRKLLSMRFLSGECLASLI